MKKYKFEVTIGYEVEAETEQEAINEVSYLISKDWPEFIDDGELTEVIGTETTTQ